MNNNGFGFSFSFGSDDDRDKDRDGNDNNGSYGVPFGGNLGDIFNQFGQMLSGMGQDIQSHDEKEPVNYQLSERIARQHLSDISPVSSEDRNAVEESMRLVELWLDEATDLPASGNKVEVWNESDWLEHTLPAWKRYVNPIASHMNDAQIDSLPAEAREIVGPLVRMMGQMSGMNVGMELGTALGKLAEHTLSGADFALPVAPQGVTAMLPHNLRKQTKHLDTPATEILLYACAREAARQRLFKHVPWLSESLVSSLEEYGKGLMIDTSEFDEAMREMQGADPQQLQEAINRLQGMDNSPKITSTNRHALTRLETHLALIEGWVDHVVHTALSERLRSLDELTSAWKRRRETGGSASNALGPVVGITFDPPHVDQAAELWRRVSVAVGTSERDKLWEHPDFLPTAEQVDKSASFIDSLLDSTNSEEFDPISEINALEEMLAKEAESKADDARSEDGEAEDTGFEDTETKDTDASADDNDPEQR